jgi:hypothetical protein
MKKLISVLFLSLMLLQAIPVLHFFSSRGEIFYAYIDEEKPGGKSIEKKDGKEYLSQPAFTPEVIVITTWFLHTQENYYPSPLLEFLTPPPNAC